MQVYGERNGIRDVCVHMFNEIDSGGRNRGILHAEGIVAVVVGNADTGKC